MDDHLLDVAERHRRQFRGSVPCQDLPVGLPVEQRRARDRACGVELDDPHAGGRHREVDDVIGMGDARGDLLKQLVDAEEGVGDEGGVLHEVRVEEEVVVLRCGDELAVRSEAPPL